MDYRGFFFSHVSVARGYSVKFLVGFPVNGFCEEM